MRNYRIVRIANLSYDPPQQALYENGSRLGLESYAEQQKAFFETECNYSNSFSRTMNSFGHDAHEIVCDLEILQKTWAREQGVKYDAARWQYDIILAQLQDLRPDVVYFQDIHSLPYPIRKDLKVRFPFIKLVVVHKGYPGPADEVADADVLFAGLTTFRQYDAAGLRPHLLYHYFDDAILDKIGAESHSRPGVQHDFTFAGSSGFGYGLGHQARYWALFDLAKKTNIELWVHDKKRPQRRPRILSPRRVKAQVRRLLRRVLGNAGVNTLRRWGGTDLAPGKLRRLVIKVIDQDGQSAKPRHQDSEMDGRRMPTRPLAELLWKRCHPAVFGTNMYRVLRQSKVTFNMHTDAASDSIGPTVGNMRMFQATGAGTCLLTDTGKNMPDLFEEDREVVTYSSIDECVEKVDYLLEHDDVRREIAAAGQRRTLRDHTVMQRCRQIDEILQEAL